VFFQGYASSPIEQEEEREMELGYDLQESLVTGKRRKSPRKDENM